MYFKNRELRVGKAFYRQPVAPRPTAHDGLWDVYFCHKAVAWIDLTSETSGCHRRNPADRSNGAAPPSGEPAAQVPTKALLGLLSARIDSDACAEIDTNGIPERNQRP